MSKRRKSMLEISMAILTHKGKILIAQRKKGKFPELMWEFPGGKLEKGETLQECVKREFLEEMNKEITVNEFFMDVLHTYPQKGDFHLNAFWATCADEIIPAMNEHEDIRWISLDELDNYSFCPADKPFIEKLKEIKKLPD